jgi:hypothetical protein
VYLERQLGMLSDLLNTSRYGQIDRLWFDEYGFGAGPSQAPPGLFPGSNPVLTSATAPHKHTRTATAFLSAACIHVPASGCRAQPVSTD